jgi:hypothetical protein
MPDKESVANGRYRFWAVEKLVRWGPTRPPTVRDHFAEYMLTNPDALEVLRKHGFYLCNDPAFLKGQVAEACGTSGDAADAAALPAPSGTSSPPAPGPAPNPRPTG